MASSGTVNKNRGTLWGANIKVTEDVWGGYAEGSYNNSKITDNLVILKGGASVTGKAVGGGTATANTGGSALGSGSVGSGNSVTLQGAAGTGGVYGAEAYGLLPVSGNKVGFDGGTIAKTVGGNVSGAEILSSSTGSTGNNTVTFLTGTNNTVTGQVSGVRNLGPGAAGGSNQVVFTNGTNTVVGGVYGVDNRGTASTSSAGNGNTVAFAGGTNNISSIVAGVYNTGAGTVGTGSSVTFTGGTNNILREASTPCTTPAPARLAATTKWT